VQESIDVVEQYYRDHGFNDVGMQYSVDRSPEKGQANITFQVKENRQSIIRDIRIDGNRLIGADIVKRALTFNTGEALDYSKLGLTRRSLYETGLYSFVDFETEELPGPDAGDKKSVRVTVQLKELSAYRLNYGGYYDTERGPGGIADFTRRSPFGFVASTGLRLRYDSELQQARLYFSQPRIKNYRLKTDLILLAQKEKRKDGTGDVIFEADRVGISLIQQRKLPDNFVFDYGYRYDHVSWTGAPEDPTLFISNTPVARATATLWRDTRDNILNATSGEFISNAFEYGPSWLGSQIGFYKYFGQYFRYVGLDRFLFHPPAVTEKGKPYTSKLVYAGAVRVGVTNTLNANESIISPELFFAGGGTTMRGFEQDKLGPLTTNSKGKLVPAGGEAMFLLNNEIRFPIYGFLGGAVFSDIGNVYRNVTDFSLTDLRKTAGFGLRVNVKYLLLRFDYGFKLDRRPGESGSEFFFSLGQAF
jgi:outer membrane protein assembly factor BamA